MINDHLMIDIETMSNIPGGVITSIGAVFFDPYSDWKEDFPKKMPLYYKNVDINSCLKIGLNVEGDTIHWWLGQGEEATKALTDPKPEKINNVIWDFMKWYWDNRDMATTQSNLKAKKKAPIYVWSHGATFDLPFLAIAANKCNKKVPWAFQNCRDTRTLFDIAFEKNKPKFEGFEGFDKHNSLHDAINQVVCVQEAYSKLGLRRTYDDQDTEKEAKT